ncbi:MAG TPA: alpha-2-macroglobulin family protein [Clostridiales bacterium]|nr:alpha-2-macroglobulin family protein [Clostridiales bacterium]
MNNKELLKNKKLIISVSVITAISILIISLLVIPNLLSDRAPASFNPGDSYTSGSSSSLKIDGAIDIVPMTADSTGVDINSCFKIVCENKQSRSFFQKTLSISPQQNYEIKEISDKEFQINFSDALKPNSIYKMSLTGVSNNKDKSNDNTSNTFDYNYSWAFQTKKSFALVRTLPGDRSTYVPVDSGIELNFSHEGVENIEQYFEINPKVNGRFEHHNKTAVFIPEKLDYGTIYTITVKKGLGIKGSDEVLSEDCVFAFETRKSPEQENTEYLSFTDILYNFTPQAEPVLSVYASQDFKDQEIAVEVYKYSNTDDLLEHLKLYNTPAYQAFGRSDSLKFDTTNLQRVTEFNTKVMNNNDIYWYGSFIIFPSNLPEGHYLINVKSKTTTYQTHIQVNDMAVYAMAGTQEGLVWINSSSTGQPIEGAAVSTVSLPSSSSPSVSSSSAQSNSLSSDVIQTVKTDKDGVAIIPGNILEICNKLKDLKRQKDQRLFFSISKNNSSDSPVFLAPLTYYSWQYSNYDYPGRKSSQKYWAYLYTDRDLYLPSDAIQIWGMVRPRIKGNLPSKGILRLHRADYFYGTGYAYGENSSLSEIISKEIDISSLGTFKSSMEISNLNPGSYFIELKLGDESVIQKYFSIRQYTKPAYKVDITPDKKVMFEWEKLNVDIQASFFEGSPVSGLDLKYSHYTTWDTRKEGNLICDENGKAELEILPISINNSWHPIALSLNLNNAKAEEEEIHSYSNVIVFPRDIMIEVNASSKNQAGTTGKTEDKSGMAGGQTGLIEIKTNRINLEKLRSQSDSWYMNTDEFRGDLVNIPLNIKIYEQHWGREETGEYYDFINKKVRKTYRYFNVKNLLQEFKANTLNSEYSYEFPIKENENYVIEVEGADSRQKPIVETAHLYRYAHPQDGNIDRYTISTGYHNDMEFGRFKSGDTVALNIKKNNEYLSSTPGSRFLYMILKDGIVSHIVENDPDYSFSFKKDFIPNIYVKAVYFDGKNIFDVENTLIGYDYKEKELIIDVKTDKHEYRPGDTVQLEVDVKDVQGTPCISEVNLSVVDEAFFAVYGQQVNTLASLYQYCFNSGILTEYLSYKPININFGAPEMGGEGGDESTRFIFKDNAFFDTITTDNNGKGKASFKLPDNLTSWRITYQGIAYQKNSDDLKAGSGKINIPVKLPFFVDVIFNNVFMDGDTVAISARSFGTQLESDKKVEYTVVLEKEGIENNNVSSGTISDANKTLEKKTYQSEGKGNDLTNIDLGKLEEGSYSVTVKAKHGNYSDAIKRDFKVVKSLLEGSKLEHYKLTDSLQPEGGKSLTTLLFNNEATSTYYNTLLSLLYSWGERVDQKLSRKIARELMSKYYKDDIWWAEGTEDYQLNSYQQYDGGIALLTYDSSNPELTAKISSLSKDLLLKNSASGNSASISSLNSLSNSLFDNTSMKWYFYKTLENRNVTPEDAAASLWGLAALNEPVLIDIENLLKSDDIGIKEKLYLSIGLAEFGNVKEARNVYDDIIKQYGVTGSPYVYIDSKAGRDDTIELTSLCSVLGFKINAPEKAGLLKYVQDNSTKYILTNIENLICVAHMTPDTAQNGSFTVDVNGRKENITLDKNRVFRLVLTPEALQNIKFSNVVGDIAVTSSYTAPVKDFAKDANSQVKIKRSYSLDGIVQSSFNQSELVKITLEPEFLETAPDGYYEITDILPAGLRYVSATGHFDQKWYPVERNGQKIVFGFYYNKNSKYRERSITYYARAVTPGRFTADHAFIKHSMSDISGFADKVQVEIKK